MIKRLFMLTIFSALLFFIVYLPISILFTYFSLSHSWLFSLIAVLIFPLGFFLNGSTQTKLGYYTLQFTNGWFASLLMLVFITFIVELIKWITKFESAYTGWFIVVLSLILIVISIICANSWSVKKIVIESDKIKKEVSFVQLSDVHAYGILAPQKIKGVFDRALQLRPNFIVVTGDLVDMPGKPPVDSLKVLDDITIPIIYELGNHEGYVGLDHVRKMTEGTKVSLVEDAALELNGVTIVSVSDPLDKDYVARTLPNIKRDESKFQVLLYHKPIEYKAAQENGIDLMLSGHTHAGQFFPVQFIVMMMYKYPWGTHNINGMTLHTSAGSGTFTWPLRLFSTNEITHITLKPKK